MPHKILKPLMLLIPINIAKLQNQFKNNHSKTLKLNLFFIEMINNNKKKLQLALKLYLKKPLKPKLLFQKCKKLKKI